MKEVIDSILVLGGLSLISITLWHVFFLTLIEAEERGIVRGRGFRIPFVVVWSSILAYLGEIGYQAVATYVNVDSPMFLMGVILVAPPIALFAQIVGEEP